MNQLSSDSVTQLDRQKPTTTLLPGQLDRYRTRNTIASSLAFHSNVQSQEGRKEAEPD
ncbi:unnamed protein product [Linum tenue]|uniref:Uncharacterized protein n=1 Tax=Linum tenue TaxID=586396 RepID=A0AAV0MQE5_9ROSI|nr:unnamed protein product [Linum tenue]